MPTQNDLSLAVVLATAMPTPAAYVGRIYTEAEQNALNRVVSTTGAPAPTQATPTFNPVAGPYVGTQSVVITSAGGTIYYTTDGTTPTVASTLYSGAVSVTASKTLKAFAIQTGKLDSAVGSAAYVIS